MNIYEAIMKAADHIERHPSRFDYWCVDIPHECGTPGCAIGWIMHFRGVRWRRDSDAIDGPVAVGVEAFVFYTRLDELSQNDWRRDAAACAHALRLYAEKYHGNDKPQPTVPNWRAMMAAPVIPEHVKSEDACHV